MSPADRIELRGLRLVARVGVLPFEREQDQPIELDLDLTCDLRTAGHSDDLVDTVDYGAVCDLAVATARAGHVALLERLAELIAAAVLGHDRRIRTVGVQVRKLRPPVPHDLASSGVRIQREGAHR